MDKEKLYNAIQGAEPLAEHHKKELQAVLGNKVVLSALREILLESDTKGSLLLAIDLNTEQGVNSARSVQGMAQGLNRAVEMLVDFAAEEVKETQDEQE